MKIGFDAKRAFVNKAGLGNYSRDVIRSLHDLYPENDYVLFSTQKETNLLEKSYHKNLITPNKTSKISKSYWRSYSILKEIENSKLDIYHGLSNELPLNINKSKVKKVVTIHDLIFIKFPQLYPYIDRKIYFKKFYSACKSADKIIATSNQTKLDIIKYFNVSENKIVVIYQSCNITFKKKINELDKQAILKKYNLPENYILTVGTVEQRKNALNVLKALYYFDLNTNYVLVGRKTPYAQEIIDYAAKHNISEKLHIIENVTNEDLPGIYQMSRLFVYPSVYEGFGIPVIEAFNSGIPVITGEIGSTAEIGGDAALQVDPHNSKSIGTGIKSVLESSDLSNQLIDAGKERAKLFDNKIVCNNIMDFYKSL